MTEAPPIKILDELAASSHDDSRFPIHELVRSGLTSIIDVHFVDGQRFWPETAVSERLNVSRMTVRRALNALTVDGTLTRYRAKGTFVNKGGQTYPLRIPSRMETGLRSVGVFIPYTGSPFWTEITDELAKVADDAGVDIHVYSTFGGEAGRDSVEQLSTEPGEEAVILLGHTHEMTKDLYLNLVERGHRVATVDIAIRDIPSPFVGVNNDLGMRLGLAHLVQLGHRRITMLVYEPPFNLNTMERVNAFRAFAAENDLCDVKVRYADLKSGGDSFKVVYAVMEQIWNGGDERPTAVFCDSGGGSIVALKWCAEQQIKVPEDLSIIGFDDTKQCGYCRPPLTVLAQPVAGIARKAVDLLVANEFAHILLPPTLVVRNSTGAAPAGG